MSRLLTLKQVADLMQISYSWVRKHWRDWLGYGVNPIDLSGTGKGPFRFKESEISRMIEQSRLIKR